MSVLSEEYLAGLVDGEGSILIIKQPYRNQWNPISQDELDNREIWRLALLGYRRRDLWQN